MAVAGRGGLAEGGGFRCGVGWVRKVARPPSPSPRGLEVPTTVPGTFCDDSLDGEAELYHIRLLRENCGDDPETWVREPVAPADESH